MTVPQTTSYMPRLRIPGKINSNEVDNFLMKKGQNMFKYYSSPTKPLNERRKRLEDLIIGRALFERDLKSRRRAYAKRHTNWVITDTPRWFPFRGDFIRKFVDNLVLWHDKRETRKFENWLLKEKNHGQKRYHGLL